MKERQTVKKNLALAKDIRQRCRTSCIELQNFLFYQQKNFQKKIISVPCVPCLSQKTEARKQFRRAFNSLSKQQQSQYYLMNLQNVEKYLKLNVKSPGDQTKIIQEEKSPGPNLIKVQFQIKDSKIYKKFQSVSANLLKNQKIIKIEGVEYQIDLHHYLLRRSKGRKNNCIIFQSTANYNQSDSIRLQFSEIDINNSHQIIKKTWQQAQYQNIKKFLTKENRFPRTISGYRLPSKASLERFDSDICILDPRDEKIIQNPSNKSSSLPIKKKQILDKIKSSLDLFNQFHEKQKNTYYSYDGTRVKKVFRLKYSENNIKYVCSLIENMKQIKNRKEVKQIKIISNIPIQKTTIFKETDILDGQNIEFVYLRQMKNQNNQIYYIQRSVELQQFQQKSNSKMGKINYCLWRVRKQASEIQVIVQANLQFNKSIKHPQKLSSLYIGSITEQRVKYISKQSLTDENNQLLSVNTNQFQNYYLQEIQDQFMLDDQQFYSIDGSIDRDNDPINQQYFINRLQNTPVLNNFNKKKNEDSMKKLWEQISTNKQTNQTTNPQDYLKHKYQIVPKNKTLPIQMRQPKGHTVFGTQWKISEAGELINLDLEKIKKQSSVLKLVLKRLGKNLLAGKSILNMSLPIQIFAVQSNLQRIARGYSYAPVFLQKAAAQKDPVNRMKQVFCFGLGNSIAYIMMQKPFNPVLGQTFQGQIDGCPVYGQQISHHPPISSILFIGRGYRVYGNFESKVQMGMNTASGINDGFNYIQFSKDKHTVRINGAPGQMSGVIIGQRKLCFAKKSYYIDQDNMIFCQISWGKQSNNRRPDSKLNDFFSGKVVKLKSGTNINDYKKIKAKDIERQYGQIHGRFTDKVYFQDELIFDVIENAPLLIQYYNPSLQSDSRHRKDIICRKKNNFSQAQDAKQQIEQIQRNDRKLRKDD